MNIFVPLWCGSMMFWCNKQPSCSTTSHLAYFELLLVSKKTNLLLLMFQLYLASVYLDKLDRALSLRYLPPFFRVFFGFVFSHSSC